MSDTYTAYLARKAQLGTDDGFTPDTLPDFLFDFQRSLVEWSLRGGRNVAKLSARYPDGFTAADSIARRDTVDAGSTRAYNPAAGGDGNG